ncbi:MAG: class I poly(R)-hydroxyalkanoic acid synthase [Burkholderiaceae bacterium]
MSVERAMPGAARDKTTAATQSRKTKAVNPDKPRRSTRKSSAPPRGAAAAEAEGQRTGAAQGGKRSSAGAAPSSDPRFFDPRSFDPRSFDPFSPQLEPLLQAAAPSAIHVDPRRLAELQADYLRRVRELLGSAEPAPPQDRRFADAAWRSGPYAWTAGLYLLNAEFMKRLADSVDGEPKARERVRFAVDQWIDAMSPANFLLTNPEAQQRLIETQGKSLQQGIQNLIGDLRKGRISQTDDSAFEVGRNVATTPGSVIYQNELIQIIQYEPTTPTVGSRPLLMVPPCINKYYILDLQPENSLVAHAVAQGHTVFMLSWRNVGPEQGHLTWDDYLEHGVIEAIRVAREISDQQRINVLGFCVGGTLLGAAAAVLAARGDRWIESMTLLTTFLDFADPGVIGLFVDEAFVAYRETTLGGGGVMPGRELAATFNFLRPNDLVWNYVVSNYLKGEAPPAFDLLYWNSDGTNLPGPMYCWYLRHTYLQNELRIPGRLRCCGQPIDLGAIGVPTYIYASREDHIVPWRGGYASTQLLKGPLRFVLGASGHIAGVINPPAKNRRSHWINDRLPTSADDWLDGALEHPGSWWPDWVDWLSAYRGESRKAPAQPGNERLRALEPAPGSYVKQRAP